MNVREQTVVVTGAAGNLGRAVAKAFSRQGARLVLIDVSLEALKQNSGVLPNTLLLGLDLMNVEDVRVGMESALHRFGNVDGLCHLAGGFRMGEPVHATSLKTWDFLEDLNVKSFLNVASHIVPRMLERGGGKIVTVGAAAALKGGAKMGAYSASKSALVRLTEAMSEELKDKDINVNCVLPSIIDTPENRNAMPHVDPNCWVTPDALADVITFLASDQARAIHGASLPVLGQV